MKINDLCNYCIFMKFGILLAIISLVGCSRATPNSPAEVNWRGDSGYFYYIDIEKDMLGVGTTPEIAKLIANENMKSYKGGMAAVIKQGRPIEIILKHGDADNYTTISRIEIIGAFADQIILNNSIITKISHSEKGADKVFVDLKESNYSALEKSDDNRGSESAGLYSEFSRRFFDKLQPYKELPPNESLHRTEH